MKAAKTPSNARTKAKTLRSAVDDEGIDYSDIPALTPDQLAKAKKVGPKKKRYTLGVLREGFGLTQVALAERAGIAQSHVSKIENEGDVQLSTLRRYVEALGAELEVAIVKDGRRYGI